MKELNPNCSELITKLNYTQRDEVVESLEKVKKQIDGWTLCAWIEMKNKECALTDKGEMSVTSFNGFLVPLNSIKIDDIIDESSIKSDGTVEGLSIDTNELKKALKGNLSSFNEKYTTALSFGKSGYKSFMLKKGKLDGIKPLNRFSPDGPYFGMHCYTTDTLHLALTQHCVKSEFPALQQVREIFNSGYKSYDGGSSHIFEDWLEEQGKEDEVDSLW